MIAVLGPGGAAVAQVGNGAVVADLGGRLASLTVSPSAGRYANQTRSLTDPDYQTHAQVVVRPGQVAGLALVTDGAGGTLRLVRQPRVRRGSAPRLLPPCSRTPEPASTVRHGIGLLAEFLGIRRPSGAARSDDDRTLVIAAVRDLDEWAAEVLLAAPDAEVRR